MDTLTKETDSSELNPFDSSLTPANVDGDETYRAICKSAVLALVFTIFSLIAAPFIFVIPELAVFSALLAFFGMLFAGLAAFNLRKYPDELVGWGPTKFGLVVSAVVFVASVGLFSYIIATEVPEGHIRISFGKLKPDKDLGETIPKIAKEYDGKKVFIKGFVRPGNRRVGLQQFILVGDFGDCCFGGNPAITDVVAIDLQDGLTADYSLRVRRIAGTFHLNKDPRPVNEDGVPQVYYTIEADYIK